MIDGAVAIVTGASSGIGEATALALARHGATVVALARRRQRIEQVAERCRTFSPDSMAVPADVADRDAVEQAVDQIVETLGRVDIVVNNAGIGMHVPAQDTSVDDVRLLLEVNFLGAVHTTMAALPGMLERGRGAIVSVTSVAGYIPNPGEAAYGASKAALSLWTHGLAVDLDGTGVSASVVSPGPIDTEIWEKEVGDAPYDGKLYPPRIVADAIVTSIERRRVHVTVPRHYGAVGALYPLLGGPMRKGLVAFERRADDH